MKIFKYAYFEYLQACYKKEIEAAKRKPVDMQSTLLNKPLDELDEKFFSDTNLLILVIELRVYNPKIFE